MRPILILALWMAAWPARAAPQEAQEELQGTPEAPLVMAPDALAQARAAEARGAPAEALSRYLRVLAMEPNDLAALAGAGRSALAVGDLNAASGFFAHAEDLAPNDGPIKAGLASTLVQTGDARGALRFFRTAVQLGVPEASIAADRGLAYDLRGDPKRAQAEYIIALHDRPQEAATVRRMALSQAIAGDRAGAELTLDPLLRRQDVPAWRTRAFVRALTGDAAAAAADAATVMPAGQVDALRPYLARLAALKPAEKAAAVFLGRFPAPPAQAGAALPPPPRLAFDPAAATAPLIVAAAPAPAAEPAIESSPGLRAIERKVAAAHAADAPPAPTKAQARAAAIAAAKDKREKAEAAAAQRAEKQNPARHWVQLAGGANVATLPKTWAALKRKWPAELAGRSPSTMRYRYTNRLLIGPFATEAAAQDWVNDHAKQGLASFPVETEAGDAVKRMGG